MRVPETLTPCDAINGTRLGRAADGVPGDAPFITMSLHKLGRVEAAQVRSRTVADTARVSCYCDRVELSGTPEALRSEDHRHEWRRPQDCRVGGPRPGTLSAVA